MTTPQAFLGGVPSQDILKHTGGPSTKSCPHPVCFLKALLYTPVGEKAFHNHLSLEPNSCFRCELEYFSPVNFEIQRFSWV